MFKLTEEENNALNSPAVFLRSKHGGRRHIPHAFTEHGVAMLSSVLGSDRAVQINILIVRTFAQARQVAQTDSDSTQKLNPIEVKLEQIERKYDDQSKTLQEIKQILSAMPTHDLPISGASSLFVSHCN